MGNSSRVEERNLHKLEDVGSAQWNENRLFIRVRQLPETCERGTVVYDLSDQRILRSTFAAVTQVIHHTFWFHLGRITNNQYFETLVDNRSKPYHEKYAFRVHS